MAALRHPNPRHPFPARDATRPKGLNALGTLALHPELARAFNTLSGHVLFASTLSVRWRELLILRTAALRRCGYEWAQHVVLAGEAGMSDEEVARVAEGPTAPGWSALEAAMLAAVDELVTTAEITDATWEVLSADLDRQQLMDLVFTVGTYDLLAMAFQSFRLEPDADLPSSGNAILFLRDQ